MRAPCRDAKRVRGMRGWRAEKRKSCSSCLAARRRLSARHMRSSSEAVAHQTTRSSIEAVAHAHLQRLSAPGPAFSAGLNLPASVSQLLAGTRSGPGGSSDAARVSRCDETRRRRPSSQLTTPRETPSVDEVMGIVRQNSGGGDYAGTDNPNSSSRRKPGSRATSTERAALDTGFRRYDGARGYESEFPSPLVGEGFPPGARSATHGGKGEGCFSI